mmetsp:Transcript_17293/g.55324  ORF Transcript_17293/g.55324 Transcript_17293/m.55324 type:complete len:245 (+) Transcript_17293:191-925(+)
MPMWHPPESTAGRGNQGRAGGRQRLAKDAEVRTRELEEADQAGELQPLRRADREPLLGVGERGDERRLGQGLGLEGEDEVVQLRQQVLQRDAAVLQPQPHRGERRAEVILHQRAEDRVRVGRRRLAGAAVDILLRDEAETHVGRLQQVEAAAHVAAPECHARLHAPVRGANPLGLSDVLGAADRLLVGEGREAEAGGARLQRGHDLGRVVADQAEAHVRHVLLDHASQRHLRGARHIVRLVEHN